MVVTLPSQDKLFLEDNNKSENVEQKIGGYSTLQNYQKSMNTMPARLQLEHWCALPE